MTYPSDRLMEAEGEADFLLCGGGVAAAHIETLSVFAGGLSTGIILADGEIGVGHREGLTQLAAGIDLASDDKVHFSARVSCFAN